MRTLVTAWAAATAVSLFAFACMAAVAPPETPVGAPVDEYAQAWRVHVPWLLLGIAMALAAGSCARGPAALRWAAALPVPVGAAMVLAVLGVNGSDTPLAVGLHTIESLLAVALALALLERVNSLENTARGDPVKRRAYGPRRDVRAFRER